MTDEDIITVDARVDEEDDEQPELRTPAPDGETGDETDEKSLEEKAKEDAKRRLHSATGVDELARTENAIEDAKAAYKTHAESLAQRKQQMRQSERKVDRLEVTIERVEELPDDAMIMQELDGGVSVEIHDEEGRDQLIEDLEESLEMHERRVEKLDNLTDSMEVEVATIIESIGELENMREMLDGRGN